MPSIQQLAAKMNRQVADGLARHIAAMPADKAAWKPLDTGRSALHQAIECGDINLWIARLLREFALPQMDPGTFKSAQAEHDTVEKAAAFVRSSAEDLCAAMEAFPTERLGDPVQFPWDEKPTTFEESFFVPYWNNTYHLGQICYIQTLYGDQEYH